MGYIVNI